MNIKNSTDRNRYSYTCLCASSFVHLRTALIVVPIYDCWFVVFEHENPPIDTWLPFLNIILLGLLHSLLTLTTTRYKPNNWACRTAEQCSRRHAASQGGAKYSQRRRITHISQRETWGLPTSSKVTLPQSDNDRALVHAHPSHSGVLLHGGWTVLHGKATTGPLWLQ